MVVGHPSRSVFFDGTVNTPYLLFSAWSIPVLQPAASVAPGHPLFLPTALLTFPPSVSDRSPFPAQP